MENALYHHGIRGMKWGIRRYQNKDGSLTTAGRKRAAKLQAAYEKTTGKKMGQGDDGSASTPQKKRSISDMSNEELKAHTDRMVLERNYITSKAQLDSLQPKHISKGEQIAKTLLYDVVKPVATNTARSYAEKFLKDKLGLDKPSEYEKLKKEVETLNLLKQRKEYSEALSDTATKRLKRENEEFQAREQNESYRKKFSPEGRAEQARKDAEKDAVDRMKNASQFINNAKSYNEGRKYFERERQEWAKQQAEEFMNSMHRNAGQQYLLEYRDDKR